MMATSSTRSTARFAALGLLAFTAACSSDPGLVAGPEAARLAPRSPSFDITPTPSTVVISSDLDASFKSFTPNNSGRGTTQFFSNYSADDPSPPTVAGCNAGYYAFGSILANCAFQASPPLSYDNRGGYTQYWSGNGTGSGDAAPFLFDGQNEYTLKLEGSYAGGSSTIGIFYVDDNGQYQFTAIPTFSAKSINSTFTVTSALTGGNDWGFYIQDENFTSQPGGCGLNTRCSDAENGYAGPEYQQFALFLNAAGTKYLVGAEDNRLDLLSTPNNTDLRDSDYNDYLISVTPLARGGAGCSPGFWKNTNAANWQKAGYSPTTLFSAVFENAFPGKTLEQVLGESGGGLNALGRQTVAALLNAGAIGTDYEYSQQAVIDKFNAVFPNGNFEAQKADFEQYIDTNGRACPLNNGRS
jgi:hypothetical protein